MFQNEIIGGCFKSSEVPTKIQEQRLYIWWHFMVNRMLFNPNESDVRILFMLLLGFCVIVIRPVEVM